MRSLEILLIAGGKTPQILTETLQGMLGLTQPIFPDRIVVITTRCGKERFVRELLTAGYLLKVTFQTRRRDTLS